MSTWKSKAVLCHILLPLAYRFVPYLILRKTSKVQKFPLILHLPFSCHSISLLFLPTKPQEIGNGLHMPSPIIFQAVIIIIFQCGICFHHSKAPAKATNDFHKGKSNGHFLVPIKLKCSSAFSRNYVLFST